MTPQKDPKIIAEQLCQFARANFVAEGTAFDETSPLAQAGIDSFALVELLSGDRVKVIRLDPSRDQVQVLTSERHSLQDPKDLIGMVL